jgi:hypothetical protein
MEIVNAPRLRTLLRRGHYKVYPCPDLGRAVACEGGFQVRNAPFTALKDRFFAQQLTGISE